MFRGKRVPASGTGGSPKFFTHNALFTSKVSRWGLIPIVASMSRHLFESSSPNELGFPVVSNFFLNRSPLVFREGRLGSRDDLVGVVREGRRSWRWCWTSPGIRGLLFRGERGEGQGSAQRSTRERKLFLHWFPFPKNLHASPGVPLNEPPITHSLRKKCWVQSSERENQLLQWVVPSGKHSTQFLHTLDGAFRR